MGKGRFVLVLVICILIVAMIAFVACKPIVETDFENKLVILSENNLKLEPLESHEIYIGVNNKNNNPQTFSLFVECISDDCDDIIPQFFPTITIDANKKAAFPMLIQTRDGAGAGTYSHKILVKAGEEVYGEDILEIRITDVINKKKAAFESGFEN